MSPMPSIDSGYLYFALALREQTTNALLDAETVQMLKTTSDLLIQKNYGEASRILDLIEGNTAHLPCLFPDAIRDIHKRLRDMILSRTARQTGITPADTLVPPLPH